MLIWQAITKDMTPRKSILKEEATTELHGVHGVSIRVFSYGFHDVLKAKIIRLKPG